MKARFDHGASGFRGNNLREVFNHALTPQD